MVEECRIAPPPPPLPEPLVLHGKGLDALPLPCPPLQPLPHAFCKGRVVTEAKNLKLEGDMLSMELERTQVINAPGVPRIPFVAGAVMDKWVPVNAVWQLLPWNKEKPTCSVRLLYVDDDFRVVEDQTGGLFIYMRPVAGSA